MIVTKEFLMSGASSKGGWNKKQVQALGYPTWVNGWFRNSIGKDIPEDRAKLFLELKDAHILRKAKRRAELEIIREKKRERKLLNIQKNELQSTPIPEITEPLTWQQQYNHPNWQRRRLAVMERDGFKCMVCGNNQQSLHVHHNTYDGKYIWDCKLSSMITLCVGCHEIYHNKKLRG